MKPLAIPGAKSFNPWKTFRNPLEKPLQSPVIPGPLNNLLLLSSYMKQPLYSNIPGKPIVTRWKNSLQALWSGKKLLQPVENYWGLWKTDSYLWKPSSIHYLRSSALGVLFWASPSDVTLRTRPLGLTMGTWLRGTWSRDSGQLHDPGAWLKALGNAVSL